MSAHTGRSPLPTSPSQLAESLANITLDDDLKARNDSIAQQDSDLSANGRVTASTIVDELKRISSGLDAIRAHFFTIQEKRHAGVFALVALPQTSVEHNHLDTPSKKSEKVATEKSVALDLEMARLNALMEDVSERLAKSEQYIQSVVEIEQGGRTSHLPHSVTRRASMSSLSSLESFDDALGGMESIGLLKTPEALSRQHTELSSAWESVQEEAKTLEAELSGDKYLLVFNSFGDQMEDMMSSLDKALASCHDFVFKFNRDRAQKIMGAKETNDSMSFGSTSLPDGKMSEDERASLSWRTTEERLAALQSVKRSFNVKRSSYGPACEQMFVALEKGVKQHATNNGTILRRYEELKTRWRSLRDRVSRMDKELRRIEAQLIDLDISEAESAAALTPDRVAVRSTLSPTLAPSMKLYSPSSQSFSPSTTPARQHSSPSASSIALSPAGVAMHVTPPSKPAKSINRMSMLDLRNKAKPSSGQFAEHARSSSVAIPSQKAYPTQSPEVGTRTSSLAYTDARRSPPTSYPREAIARREALANRTTSSSPTRPLSGTPSKSTRQTGNPQETTPLHRSGKSTGLSFKSSDAADEISMVEDEETLMNLAERVISPEGRPPSSTGLYYRPPSSASQRGDESQSRIPRLISSVRRQSIAGASKREERPTSALSFASNSTTKNFGRSPAGDARGGLQRRHDRDAALRSSMQTPEPTIMARVQRMSLFGAGNGGGTRNTRPPPTRYSTSLYRSGHNASTSSLGSIGKVSQSPETNLVNVSKRQSGLWGRAKGRTTPLSEAALAKVPQGSVDIDSTLGHGVKAKARGSTTNGDGRGATRNRASVYGSAYAPSATSGRETPTFSDGGNSSVWGAGLGVRSSSRMQGGLAYPHNRVNYRPNHNDAIDVAVAEVVNSLGVRIERVDPPLARGVKELNPSSNTLVRYQIGDKVIVCKLLQLHRPGNYSGESANKAKKVLTRVGGGWIDLEQYLLSRLGTM